MLLLSLLISFLVSSDTKNVTIANQTDNFYAIVIDGGSTGSRAFVYHICFDENGERELVGIEGQKVSPGISSFVSNPEESANYIAPVLINCKTLIPEEFYDSTSIHFKATAGMRLLSDEDQNRIYDALRDGIRNNPEIPFNLTSSEFGTIDGRYEVYYAILASNFIIGRIDTCLKPIGGGPLVGALDMGGSSTQLVFHTGTQPGEVVRVDDFWSHSWLSYGIEAVREKAWDNIVQTHASSISSSEITPDNESTFPNPCLAVGYEELSGGGEGARMLRGSGDPHGCVELIKKVLWPDGGCGVQTPCPLDGIVHPPVDGLEFFGMSVYFYALDCIRHLSPMELTWPNPSIDELQDTVHDFCRLP